MFRNPFSSRRGNRFPTFGDVFEITRHQFCLNHSMLHQSCPDDGTSQRSVCLYKCEKGCFSFPPSIGRISKVCPSETSAITWRDTKKEMIVVDKSGRLHNTEVDPLQVTGALAKYILNNWTEYDLITRASPSPHYTSELRGKVWFI